MCLAILHQYMYIPMSSRLDHDGMVWLVCCLCHSNKNPQNCLGMNICWSQGLVYTLWGTWSWTDGENLDISLRTSLFSLLTLIYITEQPIFSKLWDLIAQLCHSDRPDSGSSFEWNVNVCWNTGNRPAFLDSMPRSGFLLLTEYIRHQFHNLKCTQALGYYVLQHGRINICTRFFWQTPMCCAFSSEISLSQCHVSWPSAYEANSLWLVNPPYS